MKKWLLGLLVCSAIGGAVSAYAFLHNRGFMSGEFCTINATINCDVVNKGPFSEFYGVPVALIGMIGYALIFLGGIMKWRNPDDKTLSLFLLALACGGLGFSFYLTYLEAAVLYAWCLLCITSQIMMLGVTISAFRLAWLDEHPSSWLGRLFHK